MGNITNTAAKSAETESDPNPSNDSAAVTITGQSSADIGMTMTSNKPNPAVGTNVTFTIKASNGGPDDATGVKVTDLLPAGLSFVSATPTLGTYTAGTGLWSIGAVNNGATATLTLVAKVTAAGTIINTATKTAENEADLNPVNDAASVSLNKAVTTTTLVSSVNPSTFGQSVTFTATVASGSGTPTGTVTFKRGAAILGTATLSGGVATFTTATLPVGTGSITAAYGGDANFAPSTSAAVSQKVTKAATATALVANPATSATYGQPVKFTATVTSSGGVPAGTVTFKNGGTSLGTVTLVNGVASLTTAALPFGVRSITVVYGGNPSFATSTSPVLSFTINPAATSTALTTSQDPSVYKQPVTYRGDGDEPGPHPHWQRQVHEWGGDARDGRPVWRIRVAHHDGPHRRIALDHGGVCRDGELRDIHLHRHQPGRQSGPDAHCADDGSESLNSRAAGDSDRHRLVGLRHTDRDGDVQGRCDDARDKDSRRRRRQSEHHDPFERDAYDHRDLQRCCELHRVHITAGVPDGELEIAHRDVGEGHGRVEPGSEPHLDYGARSRDTTNAASS